MSSIRTVALAGASGHLGPAIMDELVKSGFHLTVLTREDSRASFPSSVKVAKVNYDSIESLVAALKGQDAVVSVLGFNALLAQNKLIDAAVAVGVKRFLPSEYGADTLNPKVRVLSGLFGQKAGIAEKLIKIAAEGSLTYTFVYTGPFLDMVMGRGIPGDFKEHNATLYDGGDVKFSTTTIPTTARAISSVLQHPEETKNKSIYVSGAVVTQNQLIGMAEKIQGERWTTTKASTADLEKEANEEMKKPEPNRTKIITAVIVRSIMGEGFGGFFEKNDNELLGVSPMHESEIEALVKSCC
jgi:hypothetical protein